MSSQVDQNQPQYQQVLQQDDEHKRFCKVHPYKECVFLSIDTANTTECPFKCVTCLFEQSLNTKHLLQVKQIQQSDENTIHWNWPLPDNPTLLQQIKQITSQPNSDIRFKDQIDMFFKELRAKINDKINQIEEAIVQQSKQLWDFNAHIVSEYNRLSAKEVLRHHVLDLSTDLDQLSLKIKETIASVLNSQELTEQTLKRELEDHSLQVNSVDFEGPKKIMESVLADLGKISIFLVNDLNDLARQNNPANDLGNGNAAALFQLATSKLNSVSSEFECNLKKHLLKLQRVYDKAEFGSVYQEGKQRLELELLEEQELSELVNFAELLVHNKKNPLPPNEKVWSSELVFELLSNPANQCAPGILSQLQEMLRSISSYFAQFEIAGQLPPPSDFTKLTENQLKNINTLAAKMKELSLAPGLNYSTAISPIPELQFNSLQVLQSLKREYYLQEKEEEAEIERILAQLPILELLPFNLESEFPNWRFIKTNWNSSSQLEITEVEKGSCILQKTSLYAQGVSENNLKNELMYEITCKFNRPLDDCNQIRIGLIQEQYIHSNYVGNNYDGNTIFNSSSSSNEADTLIKGVKLNSSPLRSTLSAIRFRFCIQTRQLFFFDESLQNIIKANPIQIYTTAKYRFGVSFHGPGDNYSVTVCNVRVFKDAKGIDCF